MWLSARSALCWRAPCCDGDRPDRRWKDADMRIKQDRLYSVMLIAGIAIAVLSFLGMLALTHYFPLGS